VSLNLEGIEKRYPELHLRLELHLPKGEILTLLGPSGCGKTSSLRLIAGFIRQERGRITLDGHPLDPLPPHRRNIGLVFQDYALFPHLDVRNNIGFGPRMQGWAGSEIRKRVGALLELVRLEGYESRKVGTLSGGEKQRVALARALAPKPRLLLLDEPLSALDAQLRQSLRNDIRRIQRELQVTTVYVTHDQEEALSISDRIAVMREGGIEQSGSPEEVYERPASLFVAGFVGKANLVRGILAGWEGGYALLRTAHGPLRARWAANDRQPPRMGASAVLFFRPEHCRIRGSGGNRFGGRVLRREYLGSQVRLEVESGGELYTVSLQEAAGASAGQGIELGIDPERCWLFPEPPGPGCRQAPSGPSSPES